MTEWEPATEAEAAMRDALRAGDQELYFRILARTELLLPVSAEALAGRAPMGWGTWTTGGRTHVLAFTSATALQACLADNAGSTRRAPYHELAGGWPNLEWWLAVNPGLPIEGYLPAWFVSQLARGDVRLPGRSLGSRSRVDRVESAARARATAAVPRRPSPMDPSPREQPAAFAPATDPAAAFPAPAERPAAFPADEPAAFPAERPAAYPAERPAAFPADRPAAFPARADQPTAFPPPSGPAAPVSTPPADPAFRPAEATPDAVPVIAATTRPGGDFGSRISEDGSAGWMTRPAGPTRPDPSNGPNGSPAHPDRPASPTPATRYPTRPEQERVDPPAASADAFLFTPAARVPTDEAESAERRDVPRARPPAYGPPLPTRTPGDRASGDPFPGDRASAGSLSGEPTSLRPTPAAAEGDAPPREPAPPIERSLAAPAAPAAPVSPAAPSPAAPGEAPPGFSEPMPAAPGEAPAGLSALSPAGPGEAPPGPGEAPPRFSVPAPPAAPVPAGFWEPAPAGSRLGFATPPAAGSPASPPAAPQPPAPQAPVTQPPAAQPPVAQPPAPPAPATQAPADPVPARPLPLDFVPANEVEQSLLDAAGEGSTDTFLSTLLLARVLLPVAADSAAGARPGEPGFAWRTEALDGETYVVVFTSPERLADHLVAPVETVAVKFVQLIRRWPDNEWSFAVNPGTPVGAKLPGVQIVALANWAAEVGLGDDDAGEQPPAVAAEEEAPRSTYAPAREDPGHPTMMQKTIAPSQLAYYLDRGYDRVSGFVHRASEIAHLRTPAKLHAALGLDHPGSPLRRDADEVYVLRWPAYRPSLYRIPYGGQNEAAMRAMEGWVIERPPFRGNGFAPGESSDVVAEFKVDSVRLPHGAQLWRIRTDGTEKLVATLDCDMPTWHRVGED